MNILANNVDLNIELESSMLEGNIARRGGRWGGCKPAWHGHKGMHAHSVLLFHTLSFTLIALSHQCAGAISILSSHDRRLGLPYQPPDRLLGTQQTRVKLSVKRSKLGSNQAVAGSGAGLFISPGEAEDRHTD